MSRLANYQTAYETTVSGKPADAGITGQPATISADGTVNILFSSRSPEAITALIQWLTGLLSD